MQAEQKTQPQPKTALKEGLYYDKKHKVKDYWLAQCNIGWSRFGRTQHKEKYLVLRKSKDVPNRSEELDVLEVYDKPKDWTDYSSGRALAKNRAAFYTHRYLLEDLYYIHTFDLDPLEVQDPHLFQAVLYFKSRGDNKNKLEMWFKRDDQEKRRTWTDLLDEIRSKIQSTTEYFPLESLYPEVEFSDFLLCGDQRLRPKPTKEGKKEDEKKLADARKQYCHTLKEKEIYHLRFSEHRQILPNPELRILGNKGTLFKIEFLDILTSQKIVGLDHTNICRIGGFKASPMGLIEVVDTKTQTGYNLQVKFQNADLLDSFQKKWAKIVSLNTTKKEDFRKRSESNPNPRDRRLLRDRNPPQPTAGPVVDQSEYIFTEQVRKRTTSGPSVSGVSKPYITKLRDSDSITINIEMQPLDQPFKSESLPNLITNPDAGPSSLPAVPVTVEMPQIPECPESGDPLNKKEKTVTIQTSPVRHSPNVSPRTSKESAYENPLSERRRKTPAPVSRVSDPTEVIQKHMDTQGQSEDPMDHT